MTAFESVSRPSQRPRRNSESETNPYMRNTYNAGVIVRRDERSERGYTVITAYPLNERPK